jgi:hypothetical protein
MFQNNSQATHTHTHTNTTHAHTHHTCTHTHHTCAHTNTHTHTHTHKLHLQKWSSVSLCTSIIGLEASTFFSTCVSVDEPPTVAKKRIKKFADTVLPAPDSPDTMIDWSRSSLKTRMRKKIKSLNSYYIRTKLCTNYGIHSPLHFYISQSTQTIHKFHNNLAMLFTQYAPPALQLCPFFKPVFSMPLNNLHRFLICTLTIGPVPFSWMCSITATPYFWQ